MAPEDRQFLIGLIQKHYLITDPETLATLGPPPSPQPSGTLIDRERERLLFDELVHGKRRERILLLRGEPGMGKTRLLAAWRAQLAEDPKAVVAHVSLRELAGADEFGLMESIARQLGGRDRFGSFFAVLEKEDIELSEARRIQVRESISQAFYGDLSRLAWDRAAAVLLLDDFEQASAGAAAWLGQRFLSWVVEARLPNLLVVIAGQATPEVGRDLADFALTLELGPLSQEAVREFLAAAGTPPGIDAETLHRFTQGRPDRLVQLLNQAQKEQGGPTVA
jgi:ATP/maltotriose-dependent transcriptional regulator MalT